MSDNKTCPGCGSQIPCKAFVDGCERVLARRKFCLKCRPYKKRVTMAVDGSPYAQRSDERKRQVRMAVLRLGFRRKAKLVEMMGGKCEACGYKKCSRALSFHHKDPSLKKFPLNTRTMCRSWQSVLAEANKCSLLCLNCHAEEEDRLDREDVNCYRNELRV